MTVTFAFKLLIVRLATLDDITLLIKDAFFRDRSWNDKKESDFKMLKETIVENSTHKLSYYVKRALEKNNYFLNQEVLKCVLWEKKSIHISFCSRLEFKTLLNRGSKRYLEHSGLFKEVEYNSRSHVQLFRG